VLVGVKPRAAATVDEGNPFDPGQEMIDLTGDDPDASTVAARPALIGKDCFR